MRQHMCLSRASHQAIPHLFQPCISNLKPLQISQRHQRLRQGADSRFTSKSQIRLYNRLSDIKFCIYIVELCDSSVHFHCLGKHLLTSCRHASTEIGTRASITGDNLQRLYHGVKIQEETAYSITETFVFRVFGDCELPPCSSSNGRGRHRGFVVSHLIYYGAFTI